MGEENFQCILRLYDLDKSFVQLSTEVELPFPPYVDLEIAIEKDFDDFDKDGLLKMVTRNEAGTPIETVRIEKVIYRPDKNKFMLFCSLNLKRIEMDYDFEETRSGRMLKKLRESIKERIESLTNSLSEKYENVNDLKSFIQANIGNLKSDIVRSDDGVINCACCGKHIPDKDKIFGYMNGDIIHHSCEDAYKLKLEEKDG